MLCGIVQSSPQHVQHFVKLFSPCVRQPWRAVRLMGESLSLSLGLGLGLIHCSSEMVGTQYILPVCYVVISASLVLVSGTSQGSCRCRLVNTYVLQARLDDEVEGFGVGTRGVITGGLPYCYFDVVVLFVAESSY